MEYLASLIKSVKEINQKGSNYYHFYNCCFLFPAHLLRVLVPSTIYSSVCLRPSARAAQIISPLSPPRWIFSRCFWLLKVNKQRCDGFKSYRKWNQDQSSTLYWSVCLILITFLNFCNHFSFLDLISCALIRIAFDTVHARIPSFFIVSFWTF